ncbi:MAG: DUF2865 domain-containing protein [Pseudomonadota bacterium]
MGREPRETRKRITIERKERIAADDSVASENKLKRTEISSYSNSRVRSLCVRTCDGYAFPVSHSIRIKHLEKDAAACADLCPGREMKLYFHKAKDEGMANSISYPDGTDYAALPRAFAFKQKFDPNCSCNHRIVKREVPQVATPLFTKKQAKALKKKMAETGKFQLVSTTGKPSWRPSLTAELGTGETTEVADETSSNDDAPQARRVRVIGEEFLADR